jgi:predicted outer membrane repeat protein
MKRLVRRFSSILALLLITTIANPLLAQIYVDQDATGQANGTSWNDAYTGLQAALTAAKDGDEIWVAEGTYYPTSGTDPSATFTLKTGVKLFGGFEGNETERSARSPDPTINATILSGDVGVRGESFDNVFHVVTAVGVSNAVLDGFTVSGGNANGPDSADDYGGGMVIDASSLTGRNIIIQKNQAEEGGGGVIIRGNSPSPDVAFVNVSVKQNTSIYGGGIRQGTGTLEIVNGRFEGNTADDPQSGEGGGGGLHVGTDRIFFGQTDQTLLTNVVFIDNTAKNEGGALRTSSNNTTITNSTFYSNDGYSSDALYVTSEGEPVIQNCIVWNDDIFNEGRPRAVIKSSIVEGGYPGGENIIDARPQFRGYDNLRLKSGSPALDAGENKYLPADRLDIDGDGDTSERLPVDREKTPRVSDNDGDSQTDGTVDLGAYEAPSDVVLPVELTRLSAEKSGESVVLRWGTASETNNAGFEVQRTDLSQDNSTWTRVTFIEGSGTTSQAKTYEFTDTNLPFDADTLSYRLKQVDTDGETHLSDPVHVVRSPSTEVKLRSPYPNPAESHTTVRFEIPTGSEPESTSLLVFDVAGREVRSVQLPDEPGRHEHRMRVANLPSGTYFLRLRNGDTVETRQLTIVQ